MKNQYIHHQCYLPPVSFAHCSCSIVHCMLVIFIVLSSSETFLFTLSAHMVKEKSYIDRLHLWQVFFANPYEWWDNRQSKPWANCPDFKHKDTREKIWLQPDDPPWVRKQLELHDLEVAENGHKGNGRLLKNHDWKAQDFEYTDDDEVQHSAEV